jgi:Mrp family chromosome partitioning ATPase
VRLEPAAEPENEVQFIEIGGPGTRPEASALVLASGPLPQPRVQSDSPLASTPELRTEVCAADPVESLPIGVQFQSLLRQAADLSADLITFHRPEHPVSEQYRALLSGLRATLKGPAPHLVLFTAARPAIGATTALLNLAVTAARAGDVRVAVMDANMAKPGVARGLGLTEAPGLRELVAGSVALEEALRETDQERLWAVTAGEAPGALDAAPSAEELGSLLPAMRDRFDLVVVDGPVWRDTQEIGTVAATCDAVYLVLPQAESTQNGVKDLLRTIRRRTRRLSGMILTQH